MNIIYRIPGISTLPKKRGLCGQIATYYKAEAAAIEKYAASEQAKGGQCTPDDFGYSLVSSMARSFERIAQARFPFFLLFAKSTNLEELLAARIEWQTFFGGDGKSS